MKPFPSPYRVLSILSIFLLLWTIGTFSQTSTTSTEKFTKEDSAHGWTMHSFSSQLLLGIPGREFSKFPLLAPGISDLNGNLHLRGSRAGEVAYTLDGVSVTNPLFNSNGVPLIPEAVEQIDIHTGAYGAQFGGGNGGIVSSRMKRGGEKLEFSVNAQTDDFASPGSTFLSASPTGYKRVVGAVGGTLYGARFFVAGEHKYLRNRQPMFLEPFRFDNLTTDGFGSQPEGIPLPGPVEFKRNYLYNNWRRGNTLQGNVVFPFGPIEVQAVGSYALEEHTAGGEWPWALDNYFRQDRNMINESETFFGSLRLSYEFLSATALSLTVSGYDRFGRLYDPTFGNHWTQYSDSLAFREKGLLLPDGTTGFTDRFVGPPSYSTIYFFQFRHPNSPNNNYRKERQSNFSLAADITSEISPTWTLTTGGKIEWWTMRKFHIDYIDYYNIYLDNNSSNPDEYGKRVNVIPYSRMDFYGYTLEGVEIDDGIDAPRKPQFSSLFLNNRMEGERFVLNFGGRYESFFSGAVTFPINDFRAPPIIADYNVIEEEKAIERQSVGFFLPRVNVSYSTTDGTSFYTAFGKYAQYAPLEHLLLHNVNLSRFLNPATQTQYWLGGYVPGFLADPERSTQYEFGGAFSLLSRLPISIRLYYKTFTDQLQLGRVYDAQGTPFFVALLNQGEGTSKGIELSTVLVRTNSFTMLTHYAYSDARGTTPDPFWNRVAVSDQLAYDDPEYPIPFDYDRTHRVVTVLEYRHGDGPFSLLDGFELTGLLTIQSGRRYTKIAPVLGFGAATPWNNAVRPISDPRGANPEEPYNSSRLPLYVNLDLRVSKTFSVGGIQTEFFVTVLNVFNTKHILNVFPTTGMPNDDGWMKNSLSSNFTSIPRYTEFYSAINLKNGWAYSHASGNQLYGEPMQIRAGITIDM